MTSHQLFAEALERVPGATADETLRLAEAALAHRDQTRSWVCGIMIAEPTLAAWEALSSIPPDYTDRDYTVCACWILAHRRDVPTIQRFMANPFRVAVARWYWRSATLTELQHAHNRATSAVSLNGEHDDSGTSWAYASDPAKTLGELSGKTPTDRAALNLELLISQILTERQEAHDANIAE